MQERQEVLLCSLFKWFVHSFTTFFLRNEVILPLPSRHGGDAPERWRVAVDHAGGRPIYERQICILQTRSR